MARAIPDGAGRRGVRDLTQGPISSTLLVFALPTLASNVLQSLNGAINSIWVGQLLGKTAVAATTNANLVTLMVFSLSFGLGMAITVLIGHSMGRRDIDGMRRFIGAGVTLFMLAGLGIAVGGWMCLPAVLRLLGTPPDAYPLALSYARISFLGLPASLMLSFLQSALRGTGDSVTPLLFVIPAMLIDVLLNPILILGVGPFPMLGIAGSAVASLIANVTALLLLTGFIYTRDLPVRLRGHEFAYMRPSRATMGIIIRCGVPMGLQMMAVTLASLAMVGLINRYGTTTVAAYGAARQLWTYVQMPAFAIAAAVSMMAAQSIGAGRWDRVDAIMRSGVRLNILLTGGLVLVFTLFDRTILGLFLGGAQEAVEAGRHINLLVGWGMILSGVTMAMGAVPRANGATLVPLLITIVALVPGRFGLAVILIPWLGEDGIWWSFPNGYFLSTVLMAAYYWRGGWRKVRLLGTPHLSGTTERLSPDARPDPG